MVNYPLVISYSPGCRGHFFAGLLFGSDVTVGTECWYQNNTPSVVTHDLQLDKLKQQYPTHKIIGFNIDTDGFFRAQYLMWYKLLIDSPKTWIELLMNTLSEIEFWYDKFINSRSVTHLADYTIDFDKTTDFEYICKVYQELTGNLISKEKTKLVQQYLRCQPSDSLEMQDCQDVAKVAVTIAKFKIENNLGYPTWSIRATLTPDSPVKKLQSLLTLDNY